MFDKELALNWIAALRSGKYEQATGTLCNGGAYCCLGVLAEVEPRLTYVKDSYRLDEVDMSEDEKSYYTSALNWDYCEHDKAALFTAQLDANFMEKVGLDGATADYLIQCNDDHAYTFPMIADRIEQMLEAQGLI